MSIPPLHSRATAFVRIAGALLTLAAKLPAQRPVEPAPGSIEHARIERATAVRRVLAAGVRASELDIWNALSDSAVVSHVPSLWRNPPRDSTGLTRLILLSTTARDPRLIAALQSVATDRSRPEIIRVTAICVLAHFVDPVLVPSVWRDDRTDTLRVKLGWINHPNYGGRPAPPSISEPIIRLLYTTERSDPSATVRLAAGTAREQIEGLRAVLKREPWPETRAPNGATRD